MLDTIFRAHRCSPKVAGILAVNCAAAERDGSKSHGIFRMPGYVSTLGSGWVDGRAEPVMHDAAPGVVRVDARNGFAQVALADARDLLLAKAHSQGIALLAIRESHHLAALYPDVEWFAERGVVALSVVNSIPVVAPPDARRPVYGTNPVAFAAPRAGSPPLIFDMATSTMAHGDLQVAAREGRTLAAGHGIDRAGRPTTDPQAILDGGALATFGGHKGASIAMMIELLCAALVGASFSYEVNSSAYPGACTPRTGQTVIVIDPGVGAAGLTPFAGRVEDLVGALRRAGPSRLPGDRRLVARARAAEAGMPITPEAWAALEAMLPAA